MKIENRHCFWAGASVSRKLLGKIPICPRESTCRFACFYWRHYKCWIKKRLHEPNMLIRIQV